jgi:hypothetical protein
MHFKTASSVLLIAIALNATAVGQRLIAQGDTWKYYKGSTSSPPNDASARNWTQENYNDSTGWLGPAASGFGYGDGDDATALSDMQNNYISVYLRKTFNVANPAAITRLTLAIDYDDGFVAYVNGVEVARRSMPGGTIIFSTAASSHEASRGDAGSSPQERDFIAIDPARLVTGTNVLAIEGHNSSLTTSTDFSLIPELFAGVNLLRGPYLQMPTPGGMTIVWRTDALTDSAVDYGADINYTDGTVTVASLVTEHEVTIPNLQPNQVYFYRVRSGGVTLSAGNSFRAPPITALPFRFSVIGDFGYANVDTTNVANRVAASNCDLLVTVGDNIYDPVGGNGSTGQPGVFDQYWFTPYAATLRRAPMCPALGNHDIETANGAYYISNFRLPQNGPAGLLERNYSFDYGNAHFAVIDANAFVNPYNATNSATIKNWLASDLAATQKQWKFVVYHQPAYTSSGNGTHGPATQIQTDIQPICAQYGVQMVFQGHNHWYERINPINGVNYLISGAGGRSLSSPNVFPTYSAVFNNSFFSFTQVDIDGGHLTLRQINSSGTQIDFFDLDLNHPFKIDGLVDDTSWLRAQNGLKLYAAIRKNFLYVATQDAGEGNDHFIYLNNQSAALQAANWAKAGQVMQWSAFLADENDTGFNRWYGSAQAQLTDVTRYRSMTSGLNDNGAAANGVLEGTLDLPAHFGSFPAQIYVAAAPFGTLDGNALVSGSQVPAGNGNGNIEANEFLVLNTRDIALDLPTSNAGPDQTAEAGMTVTLSGSGSSPISFPLTYAWTQLSGPAVTINNGAQSVATFAAASNVAGPTDLTFRLRVNDTRFDTDDTDVVQLYPMVDSDSDGLSDQEELTGANNVLTAANPAGLTTNPNVADTDGDGTRDGDEALAGTNPNSSASAFHVMEIQKIGGAMQITWSTVPGHVYRLQRATSLASGFTDIGDPITADGLTSSTSDSNPPNGESYYRVRLGP